MITTVMQTRRLRAHYQLKEQLLRALPLSHDGDENIPVYSTATGRTAVLKERTHVNVNRPNVLRKRPTTRYCVGNGIDIFI